MPLIGEGPAGGCGPHFNHKGRPWACCHHGSAPQVTLPRRRCLLLSGEMSLLFLFFFFLGGGYAWEGLLELGALRGVLGWSLGGGKLRPLGRARCCAIIAANSYNVVFWSVIAGRSAGIAFGGLVNNMCVKLC